MGVTEKPHERLRTAIWYAREVYNSETDPDIRQTIYSGISALNNASIAQENRESRLMQKAFGPREKE